ncbi:MAG: iron chelate uptake ABC transporter family permease subunit, partial [Cyclobacteriaceae bacterium]|nr:iron chelate uptake ABC transporter family permease subunit [Cyclobacteriaceae bacterium]
AFLGIAVPHLTRLTIQSANHKILIPATALSGIILLLICDIISQLPGSSYTLPINAVTSLIGAPVIIWVVITKGKLNRSFA